MRGMKKKRKTRKQKIKIQKRRKRQALVGFEISKELLKGKRRRGRKQEKKSKQADKVQMEYFQADLTKTLIITMLAVALEIAVWQVYFK